MKVLGIVMEANPLHLGHKYFIDKAKETVNPDITIAIVSTNFSMRGDISVIDKFTKTNALLDLGIDIVLELPFKAYLASSDYFAYNAINTLLKFKITDLAFGAEAKDLGELLELKRIKSSLDNSTIVKENLKKGYSYSTSIVKAIKEYTNDQNIITQISLPNNTLAISYLNAIDKLNKKINNTLINRIDNNYYDKEINSKIASATSLRERLINNLSIDEYTPIKLDYIDLNKANDNLYKLYQYKMISTDLIDLKNILGINEGIENRLMNFINCSSYNDYINNVLTKRYTLTHIKRLILHILNNSSDEEQLYDYLRILGLNNNGKKYLNKLDKNIKQQIITNIKNTDNKLLNSELQSTKLYGIITDRFDLYLDEYKLPIIKN